MLPLANIKASIENLTLTACHIHPYKLTTSLLSAEWISVANATNYELAFITTG